jgi:hypothetical protein
LASAALHVQHGIMLHGSLGQKIAAVQLANFCHKFIPVVINLPSDPSPHHSPGGISMVGLDAWGISMVGLDQ